MNIGDLVRYLGLGIGVVINLDEDGDPIVHFSGLENGATSQGVAWYKDSLEVINENR